jgi:glycerol-3-phosphate acyltransferase PlsY
MMPSAPLGSATKHGFTRTTSSVHNVDGSSNNCSVNRSKRLAAHGIVKHVRAIFQTLEHLLAHRRSFEGGKDLATVLLVIRLRQPLERISRIFLSAKLITIEEFQTFLEQTLKYCFVVFVAHLSLLLVRLASALFACGSNSCVVEGQETQSQTPASLPLYNI